MKRLRLIGSILYYLGFIVLVYNLLLWIDPEIFDTVRGRWASLVIFVPSFLTFTLMSEGCDLREEIIGTIVGGNDAR